MQPALPTMHADCRFAVVSTFQRKDTFTCRRKLRTIIRRPPSTMNMRPTTIARRPNTMRRATTRRQRIMRTQPTVTICKPRITPRKQRSTTLRRTAPSNSCACSRQQRPLWSLFRFAGDHLQPARPTLRRQAQLPTAADSAVAVPSPPRNSPGTACPSRCEKTC
jgi:hypothetical protein